MRLLIALIFIALVAGAWYQFGRGSADPAAWTSERIAKDPVGYLEVSLERLRQTRSDLEASRRAVRQELAEASREIASDQVAHDSYLEDLAAARAVFLRAESTGAWPVEHDGLSHTRTSLASTLKALDANRAIRAARLENGRRLVERGPTEVARIEAAINTHRRLEVDVEGRLRQARVDAARVQLDALASELQDLDATSRALTDDRELFRLEDLVDDPIRDDEMIATRDLKAILAGETR